MGGSCDNATSPGTLLWDVGDGIMEYADRSHSFASPHLLQDNNWNLAMECNLDTGLVRMTLDAIETADIYDSESTILALYEHSTKTWRNRECASCDFYTYQAGDHPEEFQGHYNQSLDYCRKRNSTYYDDNCNDGWNEACYPLAKGISCGWRARREKGIDVRIGVSQSTLAVHCLPDDGTSTDEDLVFEWSAIVEEQPSATGTTSFV